MDEKTRTVRADFDHLALLSDSGWEQNGHYDKFLLKYVTQQCENALEIGCGLGDFSRQLARRAKRVLALDLSPNMIRLAKECSAQFSNLDFQIAEAMAYDFPTAFFDCIVSIATIHHLPPEKIIAKMKNAAWKSERGGPYVPTPIVYGDCLYSCTDKGVLTCFNAKTGEQIYQQRINEQGFGLSASPVAGNGSLYFASEDGEVYVIKAGPKYELLAINPMNEAMMATPAISNNMLIIRGQHHVFGIAESKSNGLQH